MSNEVVSPLQDIIRRAAQSTTKGPASEIEKRMVGASDAVVVLVDVSGSMNETFDAGGKRMSKFQHLAIALQDVHKSLPEIQVIAFASLAKLIKVSDIDKHSPYGSGLGGGTDLGRALEEAGKLRPRKTIIISDGLPDSSDDAMEAAKQITGRIDCIYCGPDAHPAAAWLQSLARSTGGRRWSWEGKEELGTVVRLALPPGA